MRRLIPLLGVLAGLLAACSAPAGMPGADPGGSGPSVPGYRLVADVPLPGNGSRWAYQVLDARAGRLYLAHHGTGQVVVFDTVQQRVIATVPGTVSVQGLALSSATGRLYASTTSRDEVAVIDLASNRVVARVPVGGGPDGLTYVSSSNRLFVSDGLGGGETVVDAVGGRELTRIDLGPGPADSQFDPWTGRVLVTVSGTHELVAIDPATAAVVARYPLPGCEDADGLQVDVSSQDRAFVSCGGNARVLCVDLGTGQPTSSLEVGTGPDMLALDLALHRLYVASESGVLTVVDTAGTDPVVLSRGLAGPNAHSVALDPNTHLVYLPVPGPGGRSVLRVLAPI